MITAQVRELLTCPDHGAARLLLMALWRVWDSGWAASAQEEDGCCWTWMGVQLLLLSGWGWSIAPRGAAPVEKL